MSSALERNVEAQIDRLADLPREDLAANWQKMFGDPPPKGVKRGLLERAWAYRIQAKVFGGLKPATRRKLLAIAEGKQIPTDHTKRSVSVNLRPGTRLIREWNGTVHEVDVVEGGFVWNGERWTSLSAIARAITGARWSGPRFFGV